METVDYFDYLLLVVLLSLWCGLHSLLISISVTEFFKCRLGDGYRYYRLLFNLISLITLFLVFFYQQSVQTAPFFSWEGYWRIIQSLLIITALVLFYLGGRKYDAAQFLGFRQIKLGESSLSLTHSGELNTSGIMRFVRHPWYTGVLLLIWALPLDLSILLVNIVLTAYIFIGTCLEERKLVLEYGEQYKEYQKRVSMMFPFKWLTNRTREYFSS